MIFEHQLLSFHVLTISLYKWIFTAAEQDSWYAAFQQEANSPNVVNVNFADGQLNCMHSSGILVSINNVAVNYNECMQSLLRLPSVFNNWIVFDCGMSVLLIKTDDDVCNVKFLFSHFSVVLSSQWRGAEISFSIPCHPFPMVHFHSRSRSQVQSSFIPIPFSFSLVIPIPSRTHSRTASISSDNKWPVNSTMHGNVLLLWERKINQNFKNYTCHGQRKQCFIDIQSET